MPKKKKVYFINKQKQNIFAAILAKRINSFIANYIYIKRSKWIYRWRQMADLTRRVLNVIQIITKDKIKVGTVALGPLKCLFVWNGRHSTC